VDPEKRDQALVETEWTDIDTAKANADLIAASLEGAKVEEGKIYLSGPVSEVRSES
jgi:hypothetical protein